MKYTQTISKEIMRYTTKEIIVANILYKEKFKYVSEPTFYKVLSRLEFNGTLKRISKGIYCKPEEGKFQKIVANEKNIIDYYIGKYGNKGVFSGYRLFSKYELTTQVVKNIELLSTISNNEKTTIKNISIKKINLKLNQSTIKMIEFLEILQNYMKIEELNYKKLSEYIEIAANNYNEAMVIKILKSMKYKKSTIASLVNVLNFYKIETELNEYLNGTSKYKAIEMEKIHAVAS